MSDPAAPVAPSPASHPAFFAAVKATFEHLFSFLTGRGAALWNVLYPVLASEAGKALETLLPIAETIVLNLATSGQPGAEKQKIAFTQLQEAAIQAGVVAGVDVINTTVELALQNLKATGKISSTPTTAPTDQTPTA